MLASVFARAVAAAVWSAAGRPGEIPRPTYIGLAILVMLLAFVLVRAY